jgi:hypothetical protein
MTSVLARASCAKADIGARRGNYVSRQVILHVGMPKTGSTSLQRAFTDNAELLRSREIFYVLGEESGGIAQHNLIRAVRAKDASAVDDYFREASDELDGCPRILISSEIMARLRGDELAWWKAYLDLRFARPDYVIWLFIRRQATQIPSRWHGEIRHGSVVNLPIYALAAINDILRRNRLPFQNIFRNWTAVFPPASVHVVPMERLTSAGGKFLEAAFDAMFEIADVQLQERKNVNASFLPGQAELLRTISMRRARTEPDSVAEFIRPLVKLLRRGDNILSDLAAMFDPMIDHFTIEDRCDAFQSLERAAVERLGKCLQTFEDGTIFGSAPPKPVPYVRDEYWVDDSIRRRLDEAYAFAVDCWDQQAFDQAM